MSDTWGKGSVNNNIGWGQAAGSATNNWGKSQKESWAGQTDIVGVASVSITYSSSAFCSDASDPTPTISNNAGAGTFSSTAGLVFISTTTGEVDLDASTAGATYLITYTDTDAATATFSLTINALDNAAFAYSASSYTIADADPTPTITGLTGGTFSSTSGLVFVDSGTNTGSSTGEIDLSASTIASYTITYDTTSSGSSVCPNTSTFSLAVTASYSPFQMQFAVTSGVSKTISIPVRTGTSYTIDWGDGSPVLNNYSAGTKSHTYNDGTYNDVTNPTVSIGDVNDTGPMTACYFYRTGSYLDLIDIPQWGDIVWSSWYRWFWGCTGLTNISATDTPDLSNGPDMQFCFVACSNLNTPNLDNWDISNVTNLYQMFNGCTSLNTSIDNWEFIGSNNISLYRFMVSASSFNGDISTWNVSGVSSFDSCFRAAALNQNLSNWYNDGFSTNLTIMTGIFRDSQMSDNAFTDTIVGWAVAVRRDSAPYNVSGPSSTPATFQTTRTQDTDNSGNTVDYSIKYGSDWDSNWSNAGDARQFLLDNGWTIA